MINCFVTDDMEKAKGSRTHIDGGTGGGGGAGGGVGGGEGGGVGGGEEGGVYDLVHEGGGFPINIQRLLTAKVVASR